MPSLRAFLLFAIAVSAQAADVAGITLSPVIVTLDAKRPADAVTVMNETADNKIFQAEVMSWSRVNGEDRFSPATDMIVSPPMFQVVAGAKQIVRIGPRDRASANSQLEKTYRLFLQEVPEAAPVASAETGGTVLRLLMRFGIPVFIKPNKPQPESMSWKAVVAKGGLIALSVSNNGNRHLKISGVRIESAGKSASADGFVYVFAGETFTWLLKPEGPVKTGAATVHARTDDGLVHAGLTLQAP